MIPVAVAARVVIPLTDYSFYGMLELWDRTFEYTDAFAEWGDGLEATEQGKIDGAVKLLEQRGPNLSYPSSSQHT